MSVLAQDFLLNSDLFVMRNFLILAIFIISNSVAYAENHLVFFGGGGTDDSIKENEAFDFQLKTLDQALSMKNWQSEIYYRKNNKNIQNDEIQKKIQDFSSENYNKKIASLTDDILHKKYPEEDQLLIYITTHANLSASGTYQILTTDQVANAEALQKLMLAAEKMHVKLAIVDQTCYSGKILNTLTPHVCFISGSHADQIAFTGDGNHLVSEIAESSKETNLEDIYLKARLRGSLTHMASQPQISTPAGQATDALLAPFKNSISTKEDLLAHFQKFTCRNTMIGVSDLEGQLKELQVLINQNLQDQTAFKKNHELFEALKKQTEQYSYLYAQVSDALVAGDLEYCVVENRSLPNNCRTISNYEKLFKDGTDAAQQFCKKDPKSQKCSTLSFYQKLYSDLKKSSAYQRYQELTSSKAKLLSDIESLSAKIADNEKVLYDRVYKQFLKKTKGPNPCRDFKI